MHLQSFHHVKIFPNLESIHLCGSSCEEIFVNEGNTSRGEIHAVGSGTLLHVIQLSLDRLENLLHLGNSQLAAAAGPLFPNLQILYVESCNRLKNLDSSTISFQNLTTLTVSRCAGLEDLTSYLVFQNLTTLVIRSCDGLKYLTSYSVAKNLVQLTTLTVSNCDNIVAIIQASNIVGDDDDDAAGHGNEIVFSRLQHLDLYDLPSLQGCCSSGNCIVKVPPSVTLNVTDYKVKFNVSSDGVLLTERYVKIDDEKEKGVDDDDQKTDVEVVSCYSLNILIFYHPF